MRYSLLFIALFAWVRLSISQELFSNLPTIYITTDNSAPVNSTDVYVSGKITLVSPDATQNIVNATVEIKGRGNSTWSMPKKPYRIKLGTDAKLLGMPAKNRDWVLLANYADKTLMRNAVALEISRFLGMEYTPAYRFIDLFINGEYLGNYLLIDQLEVAKNRVPVEKQDSTMVTQPDITGGYLVELDGFADREPVWFTTAKGINVSVKYPDSDDINPQQLNYIKNYIGNFESTLFSSSYNDATNGYRPIVDTASLVNWYIASELTGNSDCFWSTYLYKKRSIDKLYFGPLWDYDIAFNNDNRLGDATQELMREYAHNPRTWIAQLYQDKWFVSAVGNRWKQLVAQGINDHLQVFVEDTYTQLDQSQALNFMRWNILSARVYLEQSLFPTYRGGVDFLKGYLADRVAYLTDYIAPEIKPFVTENYYYRIINKRSGLAFDLKDQSTVASTKLLLWQPVDGRLSQQWKIIQSSSDYVWLQNRLSGYYVKAMGRVVNPVQTTYNATDNSQKWRIVTVSPNVYGFVNVNSSYTLDNSGGGTSNGTALIEYDNQLTTNMNQQWVIQKVELATSVGNTATSGIGVSVFPNPAKELATVTFNLTQTGTVTLVLRNLNGSVLFESTVENANLGINEIELPLAKIGVEPGIYVVEVVTQNGDRSICKLIVQ